MKNIAIILALIVFLGLSINYWGHQEASGNKFALSLIAEAQLGRADIYLGDPQKIRTRFCFSPYGPFLASDLDKLFPNRRIIFIESDESNHWYVAMHAVNELGVKVLKVDHNILRWNDLSSPTPMNVDEEAKKTCVSTVRITFWGEHKVPTFRPIYTTEWRR